MDKLLIKIKKSSGGELQGNLNKLSKLVDIKQNEKNEVQECISYLKKQLNKKYIPKRIKKIYNDLLKSYQNELQQIKNYLKNCNTYKNCIKNEKKSRNSDDKKSKSGDNKPNPIKKITSLTYIQKKQKIVYIKKIIGEYDENELKKKANDINCNFPKKILDYSKEKRIIEMKKKIINCINRKKDNEVNLSIEELRIKTAVLKIHNSQN